MGHYDKSSHLPPRHGGVWDPRLASATRPLFQDKGTGERFGKAFSAEDVKHVAPVQTDEDGWLFYLSGRELRELLDAHRGVVRAGFIGLAGLGMQGAGVYLFLTASVVAPFALIAGSAVGAAAYAYTRASKGRKQSIEKEGKRRQAEIEAFLHPTSRRSLTQR